MNRGLITPYRVFERRSIGGLCVTHFAQKAGTIIPRHYHDSGTLFVLLQGVARDRFLRRTIECEPGSVLYRPPGEGHTHEFGRQGMSAIVIEIPAVMIEKDPALRFLSEVRFEQKAPVLAPSARFLNAVRNRATVEADLEELCLSLLTVLTRPGEGASRCGGLDRVRAILDECPLEKHSLSELGAVAGLHPSYLVNAFRKRFGTSMGQYRQRRRMEVAIDKIWNSKSPLSEIALETGFYDQSHCTNEMSKLLQLTPGQVRGMKPAIFSSSKTKPQL